jgi:hypothetical protein
VKLEAGIRSISPVVVNEGTVPLAVVQPWSGPGFAEVRSDESNGGLVRAGTLFVKELRKTL